MFIPAHGALGQYDELIYLGIAIIFFVLMGVSWFQTRMTNYDDDVKQSDATRPDPTQTPDKTDQKPDHFTLE